MKPFGSRGSMIRYARRARRILLYQGPSGLIDAIGRRLRGPSSPTRHEYRRIELREPFEPLSFPEPRQPSASVIVPIQDDLRSAHECLTALLTHSGAYPFEVIAVVDGSRGDHARYARLWRNAHLIVNREPLAFFAACNRGAENGRGRYLVFLSDRVQVRPGWLDALVGTFELRGDAGAVGARLLLSDGRLREAGGIVFEDGTHRAYGTLDDPCRPEYSYLRAVDYCSGMCMAVRSDLFGQTNGFENGFALTRYVDIDFGLRIREAGFRMYIQPLSEAVTCGPHNGDDGNGEWGGRTSDTRYRERLVKRWKYALQGHGPSLDSPERDDRRSGFKRAFFSDFAIPAPDRDSGSLRLVNLFSILQEQGYEITFASMGLEARQPYLGDLQKRGVECLYRPYEDSIEEHLRRQGARYDLVVLSRLETAAELMHSARRWCPHARILFDTVDLHFQRVEREGTVRNESRIRRIARRVKKQELALVAQADTTLVVSETERGLLAVEAPGADVRVVSNIHRIPGSQEPFPHRRDILFIGGFAHPPNTDAVLFFCQDVLPRIWYELPDVGFFVIGSDPPPEVERLASNQVRVLGYVPDVEPHLSKCRLSVAPLRFGAGIKGKINQSLAHGLPVVATSMAAEGMFLKDGESVLIADGAQEFADAVVRLYLDEALWNKVSAGGLAVMERHFGFEAARKSIKALLAG